MYVQDNVIHLQKRMELPDASYSVSYSVNKPWEHTNTDGGSQERQLQRHDVGWKLSEEGASQTGHLLPRLPETTWWSKPHVCTHARVHTHSIF